MMTVSWMRPHLQLMQVVDGGGGGAGVGGERRGAAKKRSSCRDSNSELEADTPAADAGR